MRTARNPLMLHFIRLLLVRMLEVHPFTEQMKPRQKVQKNTYSQHYHPRRCDSGGDLGHAPNQLPLVRTLIQQPAQFHSQFTLAKAIIICSASDQTKKKGGKTSVEKVICMISS